MPATCKVYFRDRPAYTLGTSCHTRVEVAEQTCYVPHIDSGPVTQAPGRAATRAAWCHSTRESAERAASLPLSRQSLYINDNDHNNSNNSHHHHYRTERRNSRFLQSPHCPANRLQHVRSSGQCASVCKSRATHQALIACNMCATWYEGTAQLLSLTRV